MSNSNESALREFRRITQAVVVPADATGGDPVTLTVSYLTPADIVGLAMEHANVLRAIFDAFAGDIARGGTENPDVAAFAAAVADKSVDFAISTVARALGSADYADQVSILPAETIAEALDATLRMTLKANGGGKKLGPILMRAMQESGLEAHVMQLVTDLKASKAS